MMRRMRFFWASMLGMQLFLLGSILSGIIPEQRKPMPAYAPALSAAVAIGGIIIVLYVLPRAMLEKLRELDVKTTVEAGESRFRDAAPVTKIVVNPEQAVLDAIQRISLLLVRSWALPTGIACFGFYLGAQRAPLGMWISFFVVAVALTLAQFPTPSKIARLIERAKGVRCDLKP